MAALPGGEGESRSSRSLVNALQDYFAIPAAPEDTLYRTTLF
jgi:hypothetical protein